MPVLNIEQKRRLSEALGFGHKRYGPVAVRMPYREEDQGGDEGGGIKQHPLLAEQPLGATSDLTAIVSEHQNVNELAEERSNEASPELKKQLQNTKQHQLGNQAAPSAPKPSPV